MTSSLRDISVCTNVPDSWIQDRCQCVDNVAFPTPESSQCKFCHILAVVTFIDSFVNVKFSEIFAFYL